MKTPKEVILDVILNGTAAEKRFLFEFDTITDHEVILKKFKVFGRGLYPRYFQYKSAKAHDEMIRNMIKSYYGMNYLNIAGRGLAKTTLKKLFDAFVLLNDKDGYRKYMKILTRDLKNSRQIVTDVYNLIVEVKDVYGDVFEKEGDIKREETMMGFTTKSGRKYTAGTVGQAQRGHIQDAYRPDWIGGDDLEDRDSVRSTTITAGIISRWEEAVDGLAKGGSYMVTANYISDQGVIEHIKSKQSVVTQITPISDMDFNPTWPERDTREDILALKKESEDFWGEFNCDPRRSENKFFDIEKIEASMRLATEPVRTSAGVNYWLSYQPHHRYGQGSDHSDGIGLDANTLAGFDFTTGELAYTYANNDIPPDLAACEFARVGAEFGNCVYAPEINAKCGGIIITTLKHLNYPNLYKQKKEERSQTIQTDKLGWETTSKTKRNMLFDFRKDYNDGLIKIYDINVLKEMKAYTNNDLQEVTTGLITRHFDLLMAVCIAWAMRNESGGVIREVFKENFDRYDL